MIRVDELLEEVQLLHEGARYQEMIDLLNDAISEDNTHAELYFFRSIAWGSIKIYDAAIDDLTKAIVLKPDYFRAYLNRGITWSFKKKYDKAIADIDQAIMLRPNHASAYRYLGDAWSNKKEYDTAITHYDKAIELKPDAAELYLDRGTAWSRKKEYGKSIEDYNKAIALQPDNSSAYTSLGSALYGTNEYDKAIESFNKAIGLRHNSGRAYFGLGLVYEAIKEFDLASIHYKRAFYFDFDGARLMEVFKERFPSPYIVKSILSGDHDNDLEANFSIVEWLLSSCKVWDSYLEHLRSKKYPVTHPEKYYSLEAMVNYYMGNPIAAYRIFDTQFDTDAHPYPLTLRDQYYLAVSAIDFNEPDNGVTYAIGQAKKENGNDPAGSYYAGQLFLLYNDPDNALLCFDRCGIFLPALYRKMTVYKLLGNAAALLHTAEKIAAAEAAPDCGMSFLNGIRPLEIHAGMPFEEMFSGILQLIHYYELTEEIAAVRRLLNKPSGFQHLEFTALLEWSPSVV